MSTVVDVRVRASEAEDDVRPPARWLRGNRMPALVVWIAALAYACLGSWYSLRRHNNFLSTFDLANFDQAFWLLAQGVEPFITQHGRHFLGDHFDPGLLVVVPAYLVGAGPSFLLVLQSVTIALVAPLLYAFARSRGASAWIALLPAALWLASPLTLGQNVDDFHHIPAAAPLIVASVVALQRDRLLLFAALALFASSFKEDVSLLYVMLGVVVLLEGRRRLGVAIAAGGAAVFAFAFFVWIPHFSDSLDWFGKRFAGERGDSVGDVAVWILRNPIAAVEHVATFENAWMVVALVVTAGGLCLLAPRWMLLALPAFLHNVVSALPEQRNLWLHYQFPVMLGLAIAAAAGAANVHRVRRPVVRRIAAVWVGIGLALFPIGVVYAMDVSAWTDAERRELGGPAARREALALVPDDAPVSASALLLPHLSQRRELYTTPLPFVYVDYGGDLTPAEFEERAPDVNYVVLDLVDRPNTLAALPEPFPNVLEREGFRVGWRRGSVLVYVRRS